MPPPQGEVKACEDSQQAPAQFHCNLCTRQEPQSDRSCYGSKIQRKNMTDNARRASGKQRQTVHLIKIFLRRGKSFIHIRSTSISAPPPGYQTGLLLDITTVGPPVEQAAGTGVILTSLNRGSGMAERSTGPRSVTLTKRASSTVMAHSTCTHLFRGQT